MDVINLVLYAMAAVVTLWSLATLVTNHKQQHLSSPVDSVPRTKSARAKPLSQQRLGKVPESYSFDI